MPNLADLQAERDSLLARVAELSRQISDELCQPSANGRRPGSGLAEWSASMERLNDAEPYDPALWEELERNLGIYEDIHGKESG